jgi:ribosomal protein S18 acetylase RimI-like enzyme
VFKLSREADLAPIASQFTVERRTGFVSFTSAGPFAPASGVHITAAPGDAAFHLFEVQGHRRAWLEPLLQNGKAFVCMLERDGVPLSVCFAFANYGSVWEVGGVVTAPSHRRMGFGARVVRTAIARLTGRGLVPRYQVEEHNDESISLARSIGLVPFLTIVHYAHEC